MAPKVSNLLRKKLPNQMATVFMCGTDCIYVEGGTGKNGRGGLSDFGFTTSVMDLYPFSNIQITTYVKIIHNVFCVKLIC